MSKAQQKCRNLIKNKSKSQKSSGVGANDNRDKEPDVDDSVKKIFHRDPNIFLLNNLLMSVQFFENYERDVRLLREEWFKDTTLPTYHKTCFHSDSLFRLSAANVKFRPRHGAHKNSETPLHPLRIYTSSDNIEAAFDPSALQRRKNMICPQYQFTVKTTEKGRKSGCVQLIEHKTMHAASDNAKAEADPWTDFPASHDSGTPNVVNEHQQSHSWRKSNFDMKNARRLTKTEKMIGCQNNPRLTERKSSLKLLSGAADAAISPGDVYKSMSPEGRVKPVSVQEFRMNRPLPSSCEIPLPCFQRQDIKQPFDANRRIGLLNSVFRSQYVLNAAAFKGYFCDVLIERLAKTLGLDSAAVNAGSVLGEFVNVDQSGMQYAIAPVIPVRDWINFVVINERSNGKEKVKELPWPSVYMQKIINILPCNAVPAGHSGVSEENPDYEKEWTLAFPKTEEFLLLHMMHAQVRCYFFALVIYKSFLESEINVGSLGPKHLLHLLFWRVHKNFLAWPEDRPGETLLAYLKALYKKIQNKYLCDFFVNSRNLFATSLPNDLHKAQTVIKKVIENPVPCVIRALRNLRLESDFYPPLDFLKLHAVLSAPNAPEKSRKTKKVKMQRVVRFEDDDDDDDERQWKKNAIRQIELERKLDDDDAPKLSVNSVNTEEPLDFDTDNHEKRARVLEIFFTHFLKMRHKSLEYKFSSQALSYLSHAEKLLDLMPSGGRNQNDLKALKGKLSKLKDAPNSPVPVPVRTSGHDSRVNAKEEQNKTCVNIQIENRKNDAEWQNSNDDASDKEEIFESKL